MGSPALADVSIIQKADSMLALLQAALSARSQLGWARWLQGEIQSFLPHDALIAAWGDFKSGVLAYDVIIRNPALSMDALPKDIIEPLMETLFGEWLARGQEPVTIDTRILRTVGSSLFSHSPCALVHGVQDRRSRYDCIYVFVGPPALAEPPSLQLCRMALPFIDTGFRQLADRGKKLAQDETTDSGFSSSSFSEGLFVDATSAPAPSSIHGDSAWAEAGERGAALSARELEIMEWVRMGKTNSEIALILNLSMFTVKNHMRRIYKKLDVLNRAQAVGCFDRGQGVRQAPGR